MVGQSFINPTWLLKALKQKLSNIFIQHWISQVQSTSESNSYKLYKVSFEQGNYISSLSPSLCKTFIRFPSRLGDGLVYKETKDFALFVTNSETSYTI